MVVYKKIVPIPRPGETLTDWLRGLVDVGELPLRALWLDAHLAQDPSHHYCAITYFHPAGE